MKVEITYPKLGRRRRVKGKLIKAAGWTLLLAAFVCPVVNLAVGGKAWSLIALLGLYMLWTLVLSPDLVEYNRISQFIKLLLSSCLLLALIELLIVPGWAAVVVPIVGFGGLIVCAALFFSDMERQRQNMLPMLSLIFLSALGSAAGLLWLKPEIRWPLAVMGLLSLALLIACAAALGRGFLIEFQKRFHIK